MADKCKYWLIKNLEDLPKDKTPLVYASKTKDGNTYLEFQDKFTRKTKAMKYTRKTSKNDVQKSSVKEFEDVQDFATVLYGEFISKRDKIASGMHTNRAKRIKAGMDRLQEISEDEYFEECLQPGNEELLVDYKSTKKLHTMRKQVAVRKSMVEDAMHINWRPWQKKVIDIISKEPDTRRVYVVIDPKGGVGKSFLARNYGVLHKDEILSITPGKKQDMLYVASQKLGFKTVFVDVCRGDNTEEDLSYSAIECLKNGYFISMKYESKECYSGPCHVVIFTNKPLDYEKMSMDRWRILFINKDQTVSEFTPEEKPMKPHDSVQMLYATASSN